MSLKAFKPEKKPLLSAKNLRDRLNFCKNTEGGQLNNGCISGGGRGALWIMPKNTTVTSKVYLDVLKENLEPIMTNLECEIFQQDGAPVHTARIVKNWLSGKNIDFLVWPGSSPDLNVIEDCWTVLKRMVAGRHPASMDDLIKSIPEVWETEITER